MQIIVVALTSGDFKCNLTLMATDLKVTVAKLVSTSRELGCSIEKLQSSSLAILQAPLQFPSRRIKRK